MTKLLSIGTGICAVCLIAFLLIAGCTSQAGGNTQGQTPVPSETPQVTDTFAATNQGSAGADSGAFVDDSESAPTPDQSQVTMAPDETVGSTGGAAGNNLTADNADFGDITP
jgi:hypothetical protein